MTVRRQGFLEKCELWKEQQRNPDFLFDVYDGKVWEDFSSFLSQSHGWCLALNIDWFQPFTHVSDSVGDYDSIKFTQRRRYKENMILVGIIPGPHEPSLKINSYLSPIVLELNTFYTGVPLPASSDVRRTVTLRLALAGVFCDLPASRKVCGFLSFHAHHGCNRCLKSFPTQSFGDCPDFSGFDRFLASA